MAASGGPLRDSARNHDVSVGRDMNGHGQADIPNGSLQPNGGTSMIKQEIVKTYEFKVAVDERLGDSGSMLDVDCADSLGSGPEYTCAGPQSSPGQVFSFTPSSTLNRQINSHRHQAHYSAEEDSSSLAGKSSLPCGHSPPSSWESPHSGGPPPYSKNNEPLPYQGVGADGLENTPGHSHLPAHNGRSELRQPQRGRHEHRSPVLAGSSQRHGNMSPIRLQRRSPSPLSLDPESVSSSGGHGVRRMISLFEKKTPQSPGTSRSGSSPSRAQSVSASKEGGPKKLESVLLTPRKSGSPAAPGGKITPRRTTARDGSPSYLQLSCSASGYGSYSPYAAKAGGAQGPAHAHSTESTETEAPQTRSEGAVPGAETSRLAGPQVETPRTQPVTNGSSPMGEAPSGTDHGCSTLNDSAPKAIPATNAAAGDGDGPHVSAAAKVPVDPSGVDGEGAGMDSGVDVIRCDSGDNAQSGRKATCDTPIVAWAEGQQPQGNQLLSTVDQKQAGPDSVLESSVKKDGVWFLKRTADVEEEFNRKCERSQVHLSSGDLTEEVSGILRAAIGKANLIITKKFKQFRGLCTKNMTQAEDEEFPATEEDLAGFWDMMDIQIEEIRQCFRDIDEMKSRGWKVEDKEIEVVTSRRHSRTLSSSDIGKVSSAKTPQKSALSRRDKDKAAGKEKSKDKTAASKTEKESAKQKAREEARKRLMAVKRAMKQRRESVEESDDVIFIGK